VPRIARLAAFALAALLFFGLPSLVSLYTDWLWFDETGYRGIFTTTLVTRVLLGLITFAVTFGWLLLNLRLALASLRFAGPILWTGQQGVQIELPGKRQLARLAMIAAAVVGLPAALYGASEWLTFLSWRHALPFGTADPVLGYDVSFYLLMQPILQLAESAGASSDSDWQSAKPYLEAITAIVGGTSGDGDDLKSAVKVVVK